MAEPRETSCQICLNADETASMLTVKIPHARFGPEATTTLCRRCVLSIADAAYNSDVFNSEEARKLLVETTQVPEPVKPADQAEPAAAVEVSEK